MTASESEWITVNDSQYIRANDSNYTNGKQWITFNDVESQMYELIHNIDVKYTNSNAIYKWWWC